MGGDDLFREFEHTGDLGIEVEAPSRAELFRRATVSLARLMVEAEGIRALEHREIEVRAESEADLLHDLLATALNQFLIESFIWHDASVIGRDGAIVATLFGERFDPSRHRLLTEIKAVTYHRLALESEGGKWRATVVFDI